MIYFFSFVSTNAFTWGVSGSMVTSILQIAGRGALPVVRRLCRVAGRLPLRFVSRCPGRVRCDT